MGRTVERLDGLAAVGTGTFGPFTVDVPGILWAGSGEGPHRPAALLGGIEVRAPAEPDPGRRSLTLADGSREILLTFPVPAPEVSGAPVDPVEAAPGCWVLHWPPPTQGWTALVESRPHLVVLSNARALLGQGEPFVRALAEIRERLGAAPLLWAPRVAVPNRLAFLAYAGVDLVDSTEALWRAREGAFLDPLLGTVPEGEGAPRPPCDCPACRGPPPLDLGGHALEALERERQLVRTMAGVGRLRDLVEARLTSEPLLVELLRHADRRLGALLEARTPVVGEGTRTYPLRESFRRPEVERFRSRFLERYRPPPAKRVLLLVPCSRTKPYRRSRSHRRFLSALEGVAGLDRVHFVSVSSPVGLVPRELEDVYPARHYDIPVTGEWDEAERAAVIAGVERLRTTGGYRRLIAHLDPAEYGFLAPELEKWNEAGFTISDDRTTAPEGLAALRAAVARALEGEEPTPGGPLALVREELESLAAVQFGPDAARRLFAAPVRLQGRPWFQRLQDGERRDLATWREARGLFHLTVEGARRLLPTHAMEVRIAPELEVRGDLFTPGVREADPAIRLGDAVVLTRGDELVAVGEAVLPGPLMTQLPKGLAVAVRHRVHSGAPAPDRQSQDRVPA